MHFQCYYVYSRLYPQCQFSDGSILKVSKKITSNEFNSMILSTLNVTIYMFIMSHQYFVSATSTALKIRTFELHLAKFGSGFVSVHFCLAHLYSWLDVDQTWHGCPIYPWEVHKGVKLGNIPPRGQCPLWGKPLVALAILL